MIDGDVKFSSLPSYCCRSCNLFVYSQYTDAWVKIFEGKYSVVWYLNEENKHCRVRGKNGFEACLPFSTPMNISLDRLQKILLISDNND
jgi:hypothetical protein